MSIPKVTILFDLTSELVWKIKIIVPLIHHKIIKMNVKLIQKQYTQFLITILIDMVFLLKDGKLSL